MEKRNQRLLLTLIICLLAACSSNQVPTVQKMPTDASQVKISQLTDIQRSESVSSISRQPEVIIKYASGSSAALAALDALSELDFSEAIRKAATCYEENVSSQSSVAAVCAAMAVAAAFSTNNYASASLWTQRAFSLVRNNKNEEFIEMFNVLKRRKVATMQGEGTNLHHIVLGQVIQRKQKFSIRLHQRKVFGKTLPAFYVSDAHNEYQFFADTGAPTFMDEATANALNAVYSGATVPVNTLDSSGLAFEYATIPKFTIGNMRSTSWPTAVTSADNYKGLNVLGIDFWSQFDSVWFNYETMRILVNHPRPEHATSCVPMYYRLTSALVTGVIAIPVTVNGDSAWAVPDIGNDIAVLASSSFYKNLASDPNVTRPVKGDEFKHVRMELGDISRVVKVKRGSGDLGDKGLVLPRWLFKSWYFDFVHQRLCLDPSEQPPDPQLPQFTSVFRAQ